MSQSAQSISNGTGAAVRAAINTALAALFSTNSGSSAPSVTVAHMFWADTNLSILWRRNAANTGWLQFATLSETFVLSRSSNTQLLLGDKGKTVIATGTFTQTFEANSILKDGWFCTYKNAGSGTITLTPGSGTIDGAASINLAPGASAQIYSNGTNLFTGIQTVPATGVTLLAKRTPGAVTTDLLTGIPSTAKRIIINFMGLAKGGTGDIAIQVGPSGGVVSTGYIGGAFRNGSSAGNTTCIYGNGAWGANGAIHGTWVLELVEASTNTWVWHGGLWSVGGFIIVPAGQIALSGALERILITDAGGSPGNFSGGSWQVSYE